MINIDGMTVAEMRAFSSSLWSVCETAFQTEVNIFKEWEAGKIQLPKEIIIELKTNIRKLQLLGVGADVLQRKDGENL
jgi:hypothetical protein